MSETPSHVAGQTHAARRTVLLALRPEFDAVRSGIYHQARRAGWRVRDLRHFEMRIPKPCHIDGVLFHLMPGQDSLVRRLLRLGAPVVQVGEHVLAKRCCCVVSDHRALGRAAAEHFAQRGFRNVACLRSRYADRSRGGFRVVADNFVQRARALGARAEFIAIQSPSLRVSWSRLGVLAGRFEKEISRFALPLGIFTYHDLMATRICEFCEMLGLSVPEQVAVLGRGNDPEQCELAPTPLSSADPNLYEQGRAAAELLDRLMDGEPPPKEPLVIPPLGIVTRQSTDVLAIPDVETARALRYMWQNLAKPLNVNGIAAAVAVSRRKLERHFRKHLGRSVTDELIRKRIERCCELLTATKLSVRDIARQVGFRSEPYFFVVFRKAVGMTPSQYRLAQTTRDREAENDENDEND
jgi:LacI family transcriptional regulator